MNTKTLTLSSMYLSYSALMIIIDTVIPGASFSVIVLSWLVSAAFLGVIPFETWVNLRVMIELTKVPRYYQTTVNLYHQTQVLRVFGTYNWSYQFLGFMVAFFVTYTGIAVCYIVLSKQGFFNRVILT